MLLQERIGEMVDGDHLVSRRAFTVLELFISLAVIGILVSLILPAVLQARAASRRLQCTNNLKQIALATQSYVEQWGAVPQLTPLFKLLPYVERTELQALLALPQFPAGANADVPAYYCPADALVGAYVNQQAFIASYPMNSGTDFVSSNGLQVQPSRRFPEISWKMVTDGLSQTALFSELLTLGAEEDPQQGGTWILNTGTAEPIRAVWWTSRQNWQRGEEEEFAAHCLDAANRISLVPPLVWRVSFSRVSSDGYQHLTPPNSVGCQAVSGAYTAVAASSYHTGGANLTLCDGSVRFVSNSIDATVWRAVGTRAGGETEEFH
ncbi:MAG: DUF1559 domain-containing protein [Planctomycetaceae bacterium]|nr:DUF1559 domain-containing protein [Planctomycetaceae bacterium]